MLSSSTAVTIAYIRVWGGQSWSWSYVSWIYIYLCNQCLTPLNCEFESRSWRGVCDTTLWDKVCQWLATSRWFSPGNLVSSTNKTDRHYITEMLVKMALNTITITLTHLGPDTVNIYTKPEYPEKTTGLSLINDKLSLQISKILYHLLCNKNVDIEFCTMLHLFDDLWLDKIIPKNNDRRQSHIWKSRE
jgi:hypothetical protein